MTTERKNFFKRYQLHLATGKDDLRPALDLVSFRDGYAYATDTYLLVKAKLKDISGFPDKELELLEGKSISSSSFRKLLEFDDVTINESGFIAQGVNGNKVSFFFNDQLIVDLKFDDVFAGILDHYREEKSVFGFNASRLNKVAKVLGVKGTLQFEAYKNNRFIVTAPNNPGVDIRCILMGVSIE